jgi:hypothetical protein
MGFHRHHIVKCHTCTRRLACGGSRSLGSWDEAKRAGWKFVVQNRLGMFLWLCPTCRRKHLPAS